MHKTILITGASGQLGQELQFLVEHNDYDLPQATFYFEDRNTLDICDDKKLESYIENNHINTIVNCAAYTNVDKAETDEVLAYQINRDAVESLARLSKEKDTQLIHVSTDYVFDGKNHAPIDENNPTNPQGVYAKSKLAGEEAIRSIAPKGAMIIRTAWIYSSFGKNFVHNMLRLGKEKNDLNVVCDQIGTPTYARDLAKAILTILKDDVRKDEVETYHYSNEGNCSWYDFTQAIFELAHIKCKVTPISTEQYPTPAKRPHYSVLNKEKIRDAYQLKIPYWRDSLKHCLNILTKEYSKTYDIGIIGSGFIGSGLAKLLIEHKDYAVSGILTRTQIDGRKDFTQNSLLTNSLDDLLEKSDLIVECSGDAIYATETIDRILKASIPVVTMNSEFHVTTGSYFVDKGLVTEAEGDQPGVQAILHEEALSMGFKPLVYANIKGFLNENPSREDMEYWGAKSNLSLEMVTSFTDGTKVQIEQVLVANGLGAGIIQEGLVKLKDDDMLHGGSILADKAKELGFPVSDYVLSSTLPAGVFMVVEHDEDQRDALRYYKLGEGPYYVIERTYHLCHLEIIKTIHRVLTGGGVLLNNGDTPKFSVAAVAKKDLKVGDKIKKGIGSFEVRGTAVEIKSNARHVPIGLLANATLKNNIKEGEKIHFDDIEIPDTLALNIWHKIIEKV